MSDAVQTIRELITGFNQIQQQMGLTPLSANSVGFTPPQTPVIQPIPLKQPAEMAQEASQQINQQVQIATRTFQAQSQFAQEFGQRMRAIQSQYVPPQYAQAMARVGGQDTFGMEGPLGDLPSPIYQTQAQMGVYRPSLPRPGMYATSGMSGAGFNAPVPSPYIPQPYMPLWPGGPQLGGMLPQVFGGQAPMGRFGEPWERNQMQQEYMGNRAFAQAMAVTPTAFTTLPGAGLGAAGGATIGGRMGGARGALLGAGIGFVGGGIAGQPLFEGLGFGRAGEALVEPAVRTRAFGNQLEAISRQFVTSGPDLHPLGRGLAQRPAIELAGQMQKMTENAEMGEFNMRDVMKITGMAAQGGMLDMAQSGPQIAGQVRNVARALQNFMKIVEEPDVQRAMQMMSNMRAMGFTVPESQIAARNAQQFARMAGVSTQGLMETAGAQGAMVFQQQGLTGGLGMTAGMGAAGLARAAIAGGAYTPGQLALAGGQQGLTQTLTEASAANLNVRFPMMAALTRNNQGQLTVDPERLNQIMSGKVDMSGQAAMASSNVQRLAEMGGKSPEYVLSEISSRTRELQDEMGRRLGPMGMQQMLVRQALNVQKELGGNVDLATALRHASGGTLSTNQAQSMALMAQNPETWRNAQQSLLADVPRQRQVEQQQREAQADAGGWRAALSQSWAGDVGRGASGAGQSISQGYRRWRTNIAEWFTGSEMTASGGMAVNIPEHLRMSAESGRTFERRRAIERAQGVQRPMGESLGALQEDDGSRLTPGQFRSATYDNAKTLIGIGTLGTGKAVMAAGAAAGLLPEATEVKTSPIVRGLAARGGIYGLRASLIPGMEAKFYADQDHLEESFIPGKREARIRERQQIIHMGKSIGWAGRAAIEGEGASAETRRTQGRELDASYQQVFGQGGTEERTKLERQLTEGAQRFMDEPQWVTETPMTEEVQRKAVDYAVAQGGDRKKIEAFMAQNWSVDPSKGSTRLGQRIMSGIGREGGVVAKGLVARQKMQAGDTGITAAATLKGAISSAKDYLEKNKKTMGAGFLSPISDESQQAYEEEMAKGGWKSKDGKDGKEVPPIVRQQLRMVKTLRAEGRREDANKLYDEALAKLSALGFSEVEIEKALNEATAFSGKAKEAALVHGKHVAGMGAKEREANLGQMVGYEGVDKEGKVQRYGGRAGRAVEDTELAAGAAAMMETKGGTMQSWIDKARKASASGDTTLEEELRSKGRESGARKELGGGGVGGKDEQATREQAESLKKTGLDVAKFNKAADNLLKASENFANGARAGNLRTAQGLRGG